MRIEKRTIVITGATSGLGKGLKEIFESKGDVVIDISIDSEQYKCDVGDYKALKKVFDDIYLNYGEIDMLITCAGYGLSGAIELLDEQQTKKQFDVNFFGTANACKYAIPIMNKKGKIIIISSVNAIFPVPFKAYYCASKAAVDNFARCLKMELARSGIQVTSICPGAVKTNFSKNRIKVYESNERYGKMIELSTSFTENADKHRMSSDHAVKKIYKICEKKHLKNRYIVGNTFKMLNFCSNKLSSVNFVDKACKKIYCKKEK